MREEETECERSAKRRGERKDKKKKYTTEKERGDKYRIEDGIEKI